MKILKKILACVLAITVMALPTSAAINPGDVVSPNVGVSGMRCNGCGQYTAMHVCASLYVDQTSAVCSEHAEDDCRVYTTYARTFMVCNNCSYTDNSSKHACVISHETSEGTIEVSTCCYIINGSYDD